MNDPQNEPRTCPYCDQPREDTFENRLRFACGTSLRSDDHKTVKQGDGCKLRDQLTAATTGSAGESAREWIKRDNRTWPHPDYAQHIIFEGCDCVVMAPESFEALHADALKLADRADAAEHKVAQHETWIRILEDRRKATRARADAAEAKLAEAQAENGILQAVNQNVRQLATERNNAQAKLADIEGMAACMEMVMTDMREAGIATSSTPPMMLPEAVFSALNKLRNELAAAQVRISELETPPVILDRPDGPGKWWEWSPVREEWDAIHVMPTATGRYDYSRPGKWTRATPPPAPKEGEG